MSQPEGSTNTELQLFYVTGTRHGSHITCRTEGEARRIFHAYYNGESIIHLWNAKTRQTLQELPTCYDEPYHLPF